MAFYSVYVTAPDRPSALALGRALVGERLAACANLIEGITSIFWWEGAVREEDEVALILKTSDARWPELLARLRELHPYKVPCAVAWKIEDGNPDYLAWISDETGS